MQVIVIREPGGPEVLALADRPDPIAGHGEVRVRVRASAVNRADVLQRLGRYPAPPGVPPDVPGLEFAGEVDDVGPGARRFRPGDRVMGLLAGGGYAQRVVVDETMCLPVPDALDWMHAAAVPEAFLTAFDALHRLARLGAGESVLVSAAGSGVGTAAVQWALTVGARVIATSRDEGRRRRLRKIGATVAVDPAADDAVGSIRAAAPDGVDVILDLVGARAWSLHADAAAERCRWILVGLLSGARCEVDLGTMLRKRLSITGTVLRTRTVEEKADLVREFSDRALARLADGSLRPPVDRVLPLARAADAHRALERNEHFGKIVLEVP